MKQKLICLMSVLLMLSLLLVGCNKKDGDGEGTTAAVTPPVVNGDEEEVIPDPGLPSVAYDREIRVVQSSERWREEWNADKENGGKEGFPVLQKALFDRNAELEEKYSISFEYYDFKLAETTTKIQNSIKGGQNNYDFLSYSNTFMVQLAQNGALHPIQAIPNIDLTAPYWYGELNELMSYRDTNFFVVGSANMFSLWTASCVWYNMDLADDLGIDTDFYGMVKEHKWTLDALLTAAQQAGYLDKTDDGLSKDDQFGISQTAGGWYTAFYGSGLMMGNKDEDGRWNYDVSDERIFDQIQKIKDYQNNEALSLKLSGGIDQWNVFRDGGALFLIEFVCVYDRIQEADLEYGILPSPLLEEGQENYYTSFHKTHSSALAVPRDVPAEDLAMIGTILEDATYKARVKQWPAYYNVLLKNRASKNPESAEMVEYVFENLILDPIVMFCEDIDNTVRGLIDGTNSAGIFSTMDSYQGAFQGKLDSFMTAFDQIIDGAS